MTIKLLIAKLFFTFLVLIVPYVIYIGNKKAIDVPRWAQWLGVFLFGGAAVTLFVAIMIAIWE